MAASFETTLNGFCQLAVSKRQLQKHQPLQAFLSAMLGGAYIGVAITAVIALAASAGAGQKIIMSAGFGLALILIVIAGADLFTGTVMYLVVAWRRHVVSGRDVLLGSGFTWTGNLVGAITYTSMFALAGAGGLYSESSELLARIAQHKVQGGGLELFARAILCNWLVCLALWMSARVDSDAARCIVVAWPLAAFIASGFEHSVANMAVLSSALLAPGSQIGFAAAAFNLAIVSLGNVVGGCLLVGLTYSKIAEPPALPPEVSALRPSHE